MEREFEYRGHRIRVHGSRLIPVRAIRPQRAARIARYLSGDLPPDNSRIWDVVAAGVAADLGIELEGMGNE